MMLAKVAKRFQQRRPTAVLGEICQRAPNYLKNLPRWKIRNCKCCQKRSVFLANGECSEFVWCAWCGANMRYEILAEEIRKRYGAELSKIRVVEFDPGSPLKSLLSASGSYTRTFFSDSVAHGEIGVAGARCEDLTSLTFPSSSIDLMISSDVLEHVIDLEAALKETVRVLAPGGVHLFTVPYRDKTRPRLSISQGKLVYLEEPEYHSDPLNEQGILAAWDIGPDLPQYIAVPGLVLEICRGPVGPDERVVWAASRRDDPNANFNQPRAANAMNMGLPERH